MNRLKGRRNERNCRNLITKFDSRIDGSRNATGGSNRLIDRFPIPAFFHNTSTFDRSLCDIQKIPRSNLSSHPMKSMMDYMALRGHLKMPMRRLPGAFLGGRKDG